MLSFQVLTEKDRREAAAIERKRALEEERKKRIFNPHSRLIGIDIDCLKVQIEEKKQRDTEQQRINRIYDDNLRKADEIAVALEKREKEEKLKIEQEINNYRKIFQKPEDRREFDLNDPNLIKKQLPCRLYDDDPRLGPSSAQKFEGEDLINEQRTKVQHEEIKAWLNQQMQEKEAADKEQKSANDAYEAAVIARDHRALQLDRMEKECRKKLHQACLNFNKALSHEKLCKNQDQQKQTAEDNMAEIYNALTSDMLTENPEVAQSNLGLGRKITSIYKGMSDADKRKIREAQLAQIEEVKKKKDLEERMKKEMDSYITGVQKSISLMDRELQLKQREKNRQIAEENKKMAAEHCSHQKYLNKIVYVNRANEDFFDQFNKSSR